MTSFVPGQILTATELNDAFASVSTIQYIFLGASTSYTLGSGTIVGERVGVKDTAGNATTVPKTIFGNIDGGTSFIINQNYGAFEFVWNGTEWSVF